MRIDVKKFLFVGTDEVKDLFFNRAQEAGTIHFIQEKAKSKGMPKELDSLLSALKILRELPPLEQEEHKGPAFQIAEKIVQTKNHMDKLQEEERLLMLEIARVKVFGDFSLDDLSYISKKGDRIVRFYCSKKGKSLDIPEDLIYIDSDHGLDYFIGFLQEDVQIEGMIEMKIEKSIGELNDRRQELHYKFSLLEEGLKKYSKNSSFLHDAFIHSLNEYHLQLAKKSTTSEIDGSLFATSGFVPLNKIEELMNLTKELDVYISEIAIEENDKVPTFLENTGASKMGEDLVDIYDTPSSTDRDPSLFVLLSFALFFSMIIGDAGYGLVLLGVSLWLKYFKFPSVKGIQKRVLNLSVVLFTCTILWGLLTTSFFGMSIDIDNPMRKFSLTSYLAEKKIEYHFYEKDQFYQDTVKKFPETKLMTDPQEIFRTAVKGEGDDREHLLLDKTIQGLMVEFALLIGTVHILMSLVRYMDRNYASFGWFLFLLGAYLYLPEYLGESTIMHYLFYFSHSALKTNGLALIGTGMFLAVAAGIYVNKLLGVLEIMTVIQIFADVLSYLRLYALGLAGGIVSATVNSFADSSFLLPGILILLIGHLINIALAVMGGVIHGLRLNFLESYHYSFYGGGTAFIPLKKIEK